MTTPSTSRSLISRFFDQFRKPRRDRRRNKPPARFRPRLEALEVRVVPAVPEDLITSTGLTVTHDETAGLQNSVETPSIPGDANDNDVAVSALPSAFSTRLTALGFNPAGAIGAAASNGNVITINGTGITDIAFTDANGDPLVNVDSGLKTTDGQEVFLFTDTNNNIALGKTSSGAIVLAVYLEETGTPVSGGKFWTVQYQSLFHNDPQQPDDPDRVDLTNKLFVTANQALEFNFDQLASGASLFGAVGSTANALVVIGEDIGLDANGKYITNQTDDVKTSQGGTGATIGIDSQMFDPGEGAFFTYVTGTDVIGVGDNANSITYDGTFEVTTASFRISQTQGNALGAAQISAFNLAGAPQAVDFVNARGTGAAANQHVSITAVRVYDAAGKLIEDSANPDPTNNVVVTLNADGTATVSGLADLYRVEWDTAGVHDQVLIKGVAGKFDIGRFSVSQPQPTPDETLQFTAQIKDADGDTATARFTIGIDGTGVNDNDQVSGVIV
jgi:hypothetical protein